MVPKETRARKARGDGELEYGWFLSHSDGTQDQVSSFPPHTKFRARGDREGGPGPAPGRSLPGCLQCLSE